MSRQGVLPDTAPDHLASLVAAVAKAESAAVTWRDRVSIFFVRNYTTEPLDPYLKFELLHEGIRPQITHGGYGRISQEVLNPESLLNQAPADVVVLSLVLDLLDGESIAENWKADEALGQIEGALQSLVDRTSSLIVTNTLIPPVGMLLAHRESREHKAQMKRLNDGLRQVAGRNADRVVLIEWNEVLRGAGDEAAIDARFWRSSQAPFRRPFLAGYAKEVVKYVRALKGRGKKCLILDCDNTLWGGVVGEDGLDGIALDPNGKPGRFYYQFQRSVLDLRERGVMLALCSKNNESDVLEVLDRHRHCVLKKAHLVAWRINWENKASNIASIAEELNIGTDSMVVVDDSPQECELISALVPDVTVVRVPGDLEHYGELLSAGGLFETLAQSEEDRRRTQMYQEEARRREHRSRTGDLTDYLQSLDTVVRVARVNEKSLARVAQLTRRTNQFNLTTRRYSEGEIREAWADADSAVYTMAVADRYGDMGLTGVFIARRHRQRKAIIDSLLLSCRVLGRQLEFGFVDQCMRMLEEIWGLEAWEAEYIPTRKNGQVSDLWERVGFQLLAEESGRKRYSRDASARSSDYLNIMTVQLE